MRSSIIFALLLLTAGASQAEDLPATLYQQPTLSETSIAFAYGGDLWIVDRDGGRARRLTTGVGVESDPFFSPDGSQIAFTGEYDGNTDVFVLPSGGGVPRRITYHPAVDEAVGWTRDGGSVLFRSNRESTSGYMRLFTVTLEPALPEALPLPLAYEGTFSPDGAHLAYQPITQWQPDWKRYQGGQTGRIWIADLADSSVERVPRENSNDVRPMWLGDTVYFVSDRAGARTIFAYDTASKEVRQVLQNDGLDVKSASAGPDALVYEQFGSIWILDPASGEAKHVPIDVESDFLAVRPRYVEVSEYIQNGAVSPSGVRAVFEARGEILTVPAEKGDPRNLTQSTGVMERDPAWSPDGKWIAYFSDESGEYALHLADQKGQGEVKKIDLGTPPSFFYSPVFSPDSKKIAYADRRLNLWYVEIDGGEPKKVDTNPVGFDLLQARWSPDSRWLTYSKYLPNVFRAVFVYSLDTGTSHQVTPSLGDATFPAFDPGGKYLYFAASTDIGRSVSWADLSAIDHVSTRNVYAVVLRKDLPSPLAPESDEEGKDEKGKEDDEKANEKKHEKKKKKDGKEEKEAEKKEEEPLRIDFEGIDQRIVALPVPAKTIVALEPGKEGVVFFAEAPPANFGNFGNGFELHRFDMEKRESESFLKGVQSFDVSANGEKMLVRTQSGWSIVETGAPPKGGDGALKTGGLTVRAEPRAEWRQMYHDAWRGERDHFCDPNLHGLDLEAASRLYEPYLDAVTHREDLNYLFREMLNQLTIGHMFIFGGDYSHAKRVPGGLLGCDYALEDGRYRFARIYSGENWNPDLRAPLTEPGVDVKEGDYLLAVGGRELHGADNVYAFFENTADKQVVIRVGPNADGSGARDVTVVPVASERSLRNRAWIEDNRRRVDELSGGRLAYIYIPNTGGSGFTSFNRDFFAQTDKEGAVVDERFNQGGLLADYVVNYLSRPQLSAITFRYAKQDIAVPQGAIYGPKAMLINSMAGSGGDAMPWYFRKMHIGPLIGTRTWGALVASRPGPRLMDGGGYTAPDAAVYGLDGEWEVENHGVAPDIEVELDPAAWRQGGDPQLERAVEYLLEELEKHPRPEVKRPEYPVYHRGNGLDKEE